MIQDPNNCSLRSLNFTKPLSLVFILLYGKLTIVVLVILLTLCLYYLGLFERDKLLFSFQMTIKIMEADGNVKQDELDFFLKGNIALEKSARQKPFAWIPDQGWEDVIRLCTVTPEVFGSLADDIERNESVWKEVRITDERCLSCPH